MITAGHKEIVGGMMSVFIILILVMTYGYIHVCVYIHHLCHAHN